MQSFTDLGVSSAVLTALNEQGVTEPFAVQRLAVGDVLAGRDVLVRSPTGSGKTLAFGIPLVERIAAEARRPAALVLAPTRELATQITEDLRGIAHSRALRVTAVYGGVGLEAQSKNAARSHILVATPGRLEDLLARRAFSLDAIQMLVLDEADRMLDMGFKPAVDRVVRACPADRQTLFFSATLDGEAGRLARSYTHDPVLHEHGPTARRAAEAVEHRFHALAGVDRVDALIEQLDIDRDLALVFVRTKHGADRLVKKLSRENVAALAMHGNKSQRQREVALRRFENGEVDVLVATDVAARGIDVSGISHVINFDAPADHETYVHRVGRTGRAGRRGIAVTLVGEDQRREVAAIADQLELPHGLGRGHGGGSQTPSRDRTPSPGRSSGQSRNGNPNPGRSSGQGRTGSGNPSSGRNAGPSRNGNGNGNGNGSPSSSRNAGQSRNGNGSPSSNRSAGQGRNGNRDGGAPGRGEATAGRHPDHVSSADGAPAPRRRRRRRPASRAA